VFKPGTQVTHPIFGRGCVLSSDERITIVAFDGSGERRIATRLAPSLFSEIQIPRQKWQPKQRKRENRDLRFQKCQFHPDLARDVTSDLREKEPVCTITGSYEVWAEGILQSVAAPEEEGKQGSSRRGISLAADPPGSPSSG
jgi:hypothetical protein